MIIKNQTERKALLICGHGSRNLDYKNDLFVLKRKIKKKLLSFDIHHCFIEINKPSLSNSIKDLINKYDKIFIFPLLIFEGKHFIEDVKEKIRLFSFNNQKKIVLLNKVSLLNDILPEMSKIIKSNISSNSYDLLITSCSISKKRKVKDELEIYTKNLSEELKIKNNIFYFVGDEKQVLTEIDKLKINCKQILIHPVFLLNGYLYQKSIDKISGGKNFKKLKPITHYEEIINNITRKLIRNFQVIN